MGELIKLGEWSDGKARLPAIIRTPGVQSLAVTVTDVSPEGACIEASPVPLPSFFLLEIDDNKRIERICRIVWRDERRLAVRFVNARTMGRSRRRPASAAETVTSYRSSATR